MIAKWLANPSIILILWVWLAKYDSLIHEIASNNFKLLYDHVNRLSHEQYRKLSTK